MGKSWENRKLPQKTDSICFDYIERKMMVSLTESKIKKKVICIFLKHDPILNFFISCTIQGCS